MSEYTCKVFACDFCRNERVDVIPKEWFLVSSVNPLDTRLRDSDKPIAYPQLHACCECGHKLHVWLDKLGIQHNFVCHQYSDQKEPGIIEVGF